MTHAIFCHQLRSYSAIETAQKENLGNQKTTCDLEERREAAESFQIPVVAVVHMEGEIAMQAPD